LTPGAPVGLLYACDDHKQDCRDVLYRPESLRVDDAWDEQAFRIAIRFEVGAKVETFALQESGAAAAAATA
jgi:hypothetical protein